MAKRLRRAEALNALVEMDAPLIDCGADGGAELTTFEAERNLRDLWRLTASLARETGRDLVMTDYGPVLGDTLTSAIDRHAALAIGSAYRAQDRR